MNILNIKSDIVKVLFYLNILLLVIGIFVPSKIYFISVIVINIVLSGTLVMINKSSSNFMVQFNKLLDKVNG